MPHPADLLNRADLAPAAELFAMACASSREHSALARRALTEYGDHGPLISGCVRDHFPEWVKDGLRALARDVTRCSGLAHSLRPKRVRTSTMRALGQAVAARDGSGFYGPQPGRFLIKVR